MKKAIITLCICYVFLAAISSRAFAHDNTCNVEFRSDITISPDAIEIASHDRQMVIKENQDLYVDGNQVQLTSKEQELVETYAAQVRDTIPEIVAVALEGVEIGLTAVTEVFYAFSKDGPPESLQNSIDSIQETVDARMRQDDNIIYLKGGEISGLESTMDDLEPALEDAIADAVGSMIVSMGEALIEEEGSLTERLAGLSRSAEQFERDIETKVKGRAERLEQRAEGLCDQVYALQATESRLHLEVPETRPFDLVKETDS